MPQHSESDEQGDAPPTREGSPCIKALHYSKWLLVIIAAVGCVHKQQAPLLLTLRQ